MQSSFFPTLLLLGLVWFLPGLAIGSEIASGMSPEREATEMSNIIMSPYCPGRTLSACPSSKARALRGELLNKFQSGESRQSVYEWLEIKYGQEIYGTPQGTFGRFVSWLVPVVFVLGGALVAVFFVTNLLRKPKSEVGLGESVGGRSSGVDGVLEKELQEIVEDRLGSKG